jgi:TM2 domain-containing membrane protein YozV
MIIVKFIIILFGLFLIISYIKSITSEHFYLYDRYNNVYCLPDDLVKRYWQRYPLDRTVDMNY